MKLQRLSKKSFVRRSLKNSWGRLVASLGIPHFHISHNAPYLPPKILHKHCFHFSWDGCNTQEKWKTKVMQNCGRQIRCIMGNVQVANGNVLRVALWPAVSRAAFKWPMDEAFAFQIMPHSAVRHIVDPVSHQAIDLTVSGLIHPNNQWMERRNLFFSLKHL